MNLWVLDTIIKNIWRYKVKTELKVFFMTDFCQSVSMLRLLEEVSVRIDRNFALRDLCGGGTLLGLLKRSV